MPSSRWWRPWSATTTSAGACCATSSRSDRWYRVFNEVSVLLFIAIVVLVVVKPF